MLTETCTFDVVAKHPSGISRRDMEPLLGITADRIREIEMDAWSKLRLRHGDEVVSDIVRWLHEKNSGERG